MKKVNLLSKSEMKKVVGGAMNPGSCRKTCPGSTEDNPIEVTCVGSPCFTTSTGCVGKGGGTDGEDDVKDCPTEGFN